jgi:vacuolar protein sorting-associated protein 13A/C
MHYDVVVKTPIIVLPRDGLASPDVLVLKLGEIIAKNRYHGDAGDATIDASLRGINMASEITVGEKKTSSQMVDDVAITATVKQSGGTCHRSDPHHADTEVGCVYSCANCRLRPTCLMSSCLSRRGSTCY